MDHRAKYQSNDRRRKSFRQHRPELGSQRFRRSIGRPSPPPPTEPNWWRPSTAATFTLPPIPARHGHSKTAASSRYWSSVASSADGTKLVATVGYTIYTASQPGAIYTSTDSGVTWTPHTSAAPFLNLNWSSVASSADGTKLVAAVSQRPDLHFHQLRRELDRTGAKWFSLDFRRLFGRWNQTGGGG